MQYRFSLCYNGEQKYFDVADGAVYALAPDVTVTVQLHSYPEYGAAEWVLSFANRGKENSGILSRICDCDCLLPMDLPEAKRAGYRPTEGDLCVITMNGTVPVYKYWENDPVSALEFQFCREYLDKAPGNSKSFQNTNGLSSNHQMPFFDVTANGSGYIMAIGWTGSWKAEFTRSDRGVAVKTGLQETCFYLKPGEQLRTSSAVVMPYGAAEDKYNKFRALIRDHFSLTGRGGRREGLMAAELWGGLTSEEMKKRINEFRAHGIQFEDIWLDAGWYGKCEKCDEAFTGDWFMHTGEWEPNLKVHPKELTDVAECANAAGMRLMLWMEPERAVCGTPVVQAHPEWFFPVPDSDSMLLDYGNPEALEYAYQILSGYVNRLNLSCYRQDFNVAPAQAWAAADEENRKGIREIRQITGMYQLWDRLLAQYPHLLIDNCSGGGRRIDVETLKRSIPFFRSDYQCNFNENPEVLQTHNSNLSRYLPYNGCTSKTKNDSYAIRSSYSSSWGGAFYNAIFQSMSDADLAWAKKYTDEYRYIRKYLSRDFYNHGSEVFDPTSWAIWQYHDPQTGKGIVMAFRREKSPFETVAIRLKGVPEGTLSIRNLDSGTETEGTDRVCLCLPEKRSSVILEYSVI